MLYRFLQQESGILHGRLLFMLLVSGAATGILVSVINVAVVQLSDQQTDPRLLLLYTIVFILYVYSQRYSLEHSIYNMENALYHLRMRIFRKLTCCSLQQQETLHPEELDSCLSNEIDLTAQLLPWVSYSAQSMSILLFCLVYLAWISVAGFIILLLTLASAVLWHLFIEMQTHDELHSLYRQEVTFLATLRRLSAQAHKVRLNRNARDEMLQHGDKIAHRSKEIRLTIDKQVISSVMSTRIAIFMLLAIFIFALPILSESDAEILFKISIAAFFIVTASAQLVYGIPYLLRLNLALYNIYQLEEQLDHPAAQALQAPLWQVDSATPETSTPPAFADNIQLLQLQKIGFSYPAGGYRELPFSLPQLDLKVHRGELVMVHGRSGSGKTTCAKIIAGLYTPTSGVIKINQEPVTGHERSLYKELFAFVSATVQPVHQLHCQLPPDTTTINNWLQRFKLEHDVYYQDGIFYHDPLSMSQQQRLAMVIALLEDKPIYLFDDPESFQESAFLVIFYSKILQELKSRGKILFVFSRTARFSRFVDRVLVLNHQDT